MQFEDILTLNNGLRKALSGVMYWLGLCSVLLWLHASVFSTVQSSEDINFRVARVELSEAKFLERRGPKGFPQTTSFIQLLQPGERRKWRSYNGAVAVRLSSDLNDLINQIEAEQMMGRRRRSKDIGKYRRGLL
uniref:Uncharacterized protein n=1 Tax=Ascaris lumbricoides TaxID=6252 RepID=A0A9J2Q7K8_ASCLU